VQPPRDLDYRVTAGDELEHGKLPQAQRAAIVAERGDRELRVEYPLTLMYPMDGLEKAVRGHISMYYPADSADEGLADHRPGERRGEEQRPAARQARDLLGDRDSAVVRVFEADDHHVWPVYLGELERIEIAVHRSGYPDLLPLLEQRGERETGQTLVVGHQYIDSHLIPS